MENKHIEEIIRRYLNANLIDCQLLGNGANGKVYRAEIDEPPYVLAVKVTNYQNMLKKEVDALNYINERVDIRLPKVYFSHLANDELPINVIGMSYLDGVGAHKINWLFVSKKKRTNFKQQVVDNLIKLREINNERFGYVDNAVYDNWLDFYRPFAKARLDWLKTLSNKGKITTRVENVLLRAYNNLTEILIDSGKPTLTHGDYWLPNFIVDKTTKSFVGCVDPFNIMYADSEYEIFALMQYPYLCIYQLYKKKVKASKYCDLKSRMYALFSEVYWCEILGNSIDKLRYMSNMVKLLEKQLDKYSINI